MKLTEYANERYSITSGLYINDLIYSAIEDNLTQMKNLKIFHMEPSLPDGTRPNRNEMEPIPTYRLKTIEKFTFDTIYNPNDFSFEFNELKKLTLGAYWDSRWANFILNHKKMKILKFNFSSDSLSENINTIINVLSQLPELEQIIVKHGEMKADLTWKTALGNQWEQTEMKDIALKQKLLKSRLDVFKSKFRRIPRKVNEN